MNLASLIRPSYDVWKGHANKSLTKIQSNLYNCLSRAIEERRPLILPTGGMRRVGKSIVMKKLSADYDFYVYNNGRMILYTETGPLLFIQKAMANIRSLRGMNRERTSVVLIDEFVSDRDLAELRDRGVAVIGISDRFEIEMPFRSHIDVSMMLEIIDKHKNDGTLDRINLEQGQSSNPEYMQLRNEFTADWGTHQ